MWLSVGTPYLAFPTPLACPHTQVDSASNRAAVVIVHSNHVQMDRYTGLLLLYKDGL